MVPASSADDAIFVSLDRPDPFQPAFGDVEIEAIVSTSEEIERVVFYVDGVVMGELQQPPWVFSVNLGEDVGQHRFEAIAYGLSGTTGSGGVTTPGIRVDEEVRINLQQLYVTVSRDEERVLALQQDDFLIFDNKRRQELVTFARGDIPFTAMVLVDSSTSMRGEKLQAALGGARAFFDGMRELDEGKLLVFSDRILHTTPFTTFSSVLSAGLGQVQAQGGTALNDHLYLSLKQLERRQGRRVVLILSDGVDSHSVLTMRDVLAMARRSQALIYWLRLPYGVEAADHHDLPNLTTAWRDTATYHSEFEKLQRTVLESGGRIHILNFLDEIGSAFQEILAELREQYVLGYYPSVSRRDGGWHEVTVRVDGENLVVRSRNGYLDL
jgi:Ca-activated chloride channel family protein